MEGLGAAQRRTVGELRAFTGASVAQAVELLAATGWSIEQAADVFFTSGMVAEAAAGPAVPAVDLGKIDSWFDAYKEEDSSDMMEAEGVQRFCEDLKLDPEDAVMLVISQYMGAATYTRTVTVPPSFATAGRTTWLVIERFQRAGVISAVSHALPT